MHLPLKRVDERLHPVLIDSVQRHHFLVDVEDSKRPPVCGAEALNDGLRDVTARREGDRGPGIQTGALDLDLLAGERPCIGATPVANPDHVLVHADGHFTQESIVRRVVDAHLVSENPVPAGHQLPSIQEALPSIGIGEV